MRTILAVILAIFVLGCVSSLTAKNVVNLAYERYNSSKSYSAVIYTNKTRIYVLYEKPDKIRIQYNNTTVVINGKKMLLCNRTGYKVLKYSGPVDIYYGQFLKRMEKLKARIVGQEKVNGVECYVLKFNDTGKSFRIVKAWIVKGLWKIAKLQLLVNSGKGFRKVNLTYFIKFNVKVRGFEFVCW